MLQECYSRGQGVRSSLLFVEKSGIPRINLMLIGPGIFFAFLSAADNPRRKLSKFSTQLS